MAISAGRMREAEFRFIQIVEQLYTGHPPAGIPFANPTAIIQTVQHLDGRSANMKFSTALTALTALGSQAAANSLTRPAGFAYAEGENFMVDGKPFLFAGSNAYWLPFINSPADVELSIKESKRAGQKVIRTWGFNEKNVTFVPGGLPMYGGDTSFYFQSWENGKATVNTGATGLEVLDNVVRLAEANDMKLLVALTNNWADYGGMDVYTINLGFQYHDDFYREPTIKDAYKNYVSTVINRYKNSPAIFAWELANEARCSADGTKGLPRSASCSFNTTSAWYKEMGAFVKSIDPHHMVTWGGEGEFYEEGATDGFYSGYDGGNFYHELALPEMDFGTFHLYPDWWAKSVEWANQWVIDHGVAQQTLKKPVLFEEYGWLTPEFRLQNLNRVAPANETRVTVLQKWQELSLKYNMSDMYWQLGLCELTIGCSTNDGFTIYLNNTPEATPLIFDHANAINAKNSGL
ncbi:hypothetical protein PZA11_006665 [Diplocarpon coronariae]